MFLRKYLGRLLFWNKGDSRFIKNRAREDIEAEEIFLDAEAIRSLEEKGKMEQPIKHRNFILFYGLIIICLLGLFLRAGYLQIVKGEYYQDLAQGNRLRIYSIAAPRGIIYDRFGEPLVYNIPSFDLLVNLADFFDNPLALQDEILEKVAQVIEQGTEERFTPSSRQPINPRPSFDDLKEKIEEARGEVSQLVLVKNISRSAALVLESLVGDWPGLRMEENAQRQYLLGPYFSHILGYTGQVSQSDLVSHPDYFLNDQIGKDGLECQYEGVLRGEDGQEQVEVDFLGKTQRVLASKPSQPGQGLVLFIDQGLQSKIHQTLDQRLQQLFVDGKQIRKATVVALNPNNGAVLALVSVPSFDNNLFAQGISQTDLDRLDNDPNQPFLNRAVAGQYPPGSIIKPLIGAAALEEEVVGPGQTVNCQGGLTIFNKYDPQIVYHFADWQTHGLTDIVKGIAQSCNVFFYTVGGGYGQIEGLGIERIKKYLQYFGLGQSTDIDLPHEEIGLVPDEQWKSEQKPNEEWYLGDTYHLAIGQGDVLVTPLQMTAAVAAIANGGTLYQPQIVDKIIDSSESFEDIEERHIIEEVVAKVVRQNFIQPVNIEVVQEGMRQAVLSGSVRSLADLPVEVAGKTGTAQFGTQGQTHAWFIGFAPYDNPQIVLTVLVEGGGEGHQAAVPVAKEVLKWYFSQ